MGRLRGNFGMGGDELLADVPATIADAARALGFTPKTIRQWLRDGAPCVREGKPGPGSGALVRVDDLRQWRRNRAGLGDAGNSGRVPERIGDALLETLRADAGNGQPAPAALGISSAPAAGLLVFAFDRMFRALTGREPGEGDYPESVAQLVRIAQTEHKGSYSIR